MRNLTQDQKNLINKIASTQDWMELTLSEREALHAFEQWGWAHFQHRKVEAWSGHEYRIFWTMHGELSLGLQELNLRMTRIEQSLGLLNTYIQNSSGYEENDDDLAGT